MIEWIKCSERMPEMYQEVLVAEPWEASDGRSGFKIIKTDCSNPDPDAAVRFFEGARVINASHWAEVNYPENAK